MVRRVVALLDGPVAARRLAPGWPVAAVVAASLLIAACLCLGRAHARTAPASPEPEFDGVGRPASSWRNVPPGGWCGLPGAFVVNDGQWGEPTGHAPRFVARRGPLAIHAYDDGLGVVLARAAPQVRAPAARVLPPELDPVLGRVETCGLRLRFEGAVAVRPEGRTLLPTRFHYFVGRDRARWRSDVRAYRDLGYAGLYAGVDLVVRGGDGTDFEYDLHFARAASLAAVAIRVEGARAPLRVDAGGALVIATPLGDVRQPRPSAWTGDGTSTRPVACAFELLGADRFGFRADGLDPDAALVIDPQVQTSTYYGGRAWDEVFDMVADGDDVVLAGRTFSVDFPTRAPLQAGLAGASDAFVLRLPLDGGPPRFATYLGGTLDDEARALVLDPDGAPVFGGATYSPDFPTVKGFQATHAGRFDAFVAALSPSGDTLRYASFLGGSGADGVVGMTLDASGAAILAGGTASSDFPVRNAFQADSGGAYDAFLARVPLTGAPPSLVTYVGGVADDGAVAVRLDAQGMAVVAGFTFSPDFPTQNAFQSGHGGSADAFVCRLPLTGGPPLYSTFLGGGDSEIAYRLALDASGAAVLAGGTSSPDFPTRNAFQAQLRGASDAFVTRLPLTGAPPIDSTYLGGAVTETALGLALDAHDDAVVTGWTFSSDFPLRDPYQSAPVGGAEVFVARLPAGGGAPTYSTYLGGSTLDKSYALTIDASNVAIVVGLTDSVDFPLRRPFQASLAGYFDVFVARLDLLPLGASTFGASTAGCAGSLPIGVVASPRIGSVAFALTCEQAPASAVGLFALSSAALAAPLPIRGAQLWLDPSASLFVAAFLASGPDGRAAVPLPIPWDPHLAGAQVCAQFFWADACASGGMSASNALRVTVQP